MAEAADQGPESSQKKMDEYLLDNVAKQLEKQEKYASSFSGSVDQPEPDPETLVSLQGGTAVSSSSVKSGSDKQTEAGQRISATPEPKTALTPEPKVLSPTPSSEPKALSPAPTLEPQVASRTPTPAPEPRAVTPAVEVVQSEKEADTESTEAKPAAVSEAEQVKDSVSIKTEGEEDAKSSVDPDYAAMVRAEAGFGAFPMPSRSPSPAPSSSIAQPDTTVTLPPSTQEPTGVPEPAKVWTGWMDEWEGGWLDG